MKGLVLAALLCSAPALASGPAGACLEQRDLDGAGFVVRFLQHPDGVGRPRRIVLRFAPGRCSSVESGQPRALRVYPGDDYDLVLATPAGAAESTLQLRRHDGSLASFLGRVPNDWLADSEPIGLGALWLLARRGESVAYGIGELMPLPPLPDALTQARR